MPSLPRCLAPLAVALATATLGGCHLTYWDYRSKDDVPVREVRSVKVQDVQPITNGTGDGATCKVLVSQHVIEYVGEREIEYDIEWSLLVDWLDESAGFRLTDYWWNESDDAFPICEASGIGDAIGDSEDPFSFLFFMGLALPMMAADMAMYVCAPAVDVCIMALLGAIDLVPGTLSAPPVLVLSALDGIDPAAQTEVYSEKDVEEPADGARFRYAFDLPGVGGGEEVTASDGSLVLPVGRAVEQALRSGHAPLTVRLTYSGHPDVTASVRLDAAQLVAIHAGGRLRGKPDTERIQAWRSILASAPKSSEAVRSAVEQELLGLNFIAQWGDRETLAKFTEKDGGVAVMPDGAEVDWTAGKPTRAPYAVVTLQIAEGRGSVVSGQPVGIVVTARNDGKGTLYRLKAQTRSNLDTASGLPILFGKLEPGQKVVRRVDLPTDIRQGSDVVSLVLDFDELNGYAPAGEQGRVRLVAAPRPRLGYDFRVVEDNSGESRGNGDGVIQRGEAVDLYVTVANRGSAGAEQVELALDLQQKEGVDVFGTSRHGAETLAPGASRTFRTTFSVKPTFLGDVVPVRIAVNESSPFQVSLSDRIELRIDREAPRKVLALDQEIYVTEKTQLLDAAAEHAQPLAAVEKGSQLKAVGQLGEYYQIAYSSKRRGSTRAWIRKAAVTAERPADLAGPAASGPASGPVAVVREYVNNPPRVILIEPRGGRADTAEKDFPLSLVASDDRGVASVRVLVNGRPLPQVTGTVRGIGGVRRAAPAPEEGAQRELYVDERIPLKPGVNTVKVVAVDVDGMEVVATAVIQRAVREPTVVAVVVGVNRYDDPSIPALRYAEADARALAEFLKTSPGSPVKNPDDVELLTGAQATKLAVLQAIEGSLLKRATHKEDMAIFYFAGHGYSQSERYYLAGVDCRKESLRTTGIGREELQGLWGDIAAERKLFLADACHSGGLQGMRGDNLIHQGLAKLGSGKGSFTILAAGPKQQSAEDEQLGHGVFTFALLEGLKGKADQDAGNRDGRVTVKELMTYLGDEVPALARKQNVEQNPTCEMFGSEGELFLTR